MIRIFCLLLLLCPLRNIAQNSVLTGNIRSAADTSYPIADASLRLLHARLQSWSQPDGSFRFTNTKLPDTLLVSITGYQTVRIPVTTATTLTILLSPITAELESVVVATGYQSIPVERTTGSFTALNSSLLQRRVSTNIIDRLDGVASGLLFNRNKTPNANESSILIRGRSTLFASPEPLVVVDNFPYDGDLNSLNPNDIESVTLLKDAAAASIWGARSGNGVIVITTKKARAATRPHFNFNTNLTWIDKPDLYYQPLASASDLIKMESFLFGKGYYNSRINLPYTALSPAVDVMAQRRSGLISASDSAGLINTLHTIDSRSDQLNYLYRPALLQQYSFSVNGGSTSSSYYLSGGLDRNLNTQKGSELSRATINAAHQLQLVPGKLEFNTCFSLTQNRSTPPASVFNSGIPIYQALVDASGSALPYYKDYRKRWLDTIAAGQLLDWNYRPVDEISLNNNRTRNTEFRLNHQLNWQLLRTLRFSALYQYQQGYTETRNLQSSDQYYTRDLINRYTQPDYTGSLATRAIPLGDIIDLTQSRYSTHNGRLQLNFSQVWQGKHRLEALAGWEIKAFNSNSNTFRRYGYDDNNETDISVNPIITFFTLPAGTLSRIPSNNGARSATDHYLSYFTNIGYTYTDRYQISASARRDESNLFGVEANQKGVPLWSLGAGWWINRESFFKTRWIDQLKLRLSYGYNGNIDKSTTAYTTAGIAISSFYSQPTLWLINPPNPELRWEKIATWNLGLDFSFLHHRIWGNIDVFQKSGKDLIGTSPVASQTGITQFRQNIANLRTTGFDLTLNANLINSALKWNIQALISHATDKVTGYLVQPPALKNYLTNATSYPMEGKPWSALFAYRWAGLTSTTGDPQGIIDGTKTTTYNRLISPQSLSELVYFGSARPTSFGSIRNDFSFKNWRFSFNVVYNWGYYFRKPVLSYSSAFSSSLSGSAALHNSYSLRWQQPGDETRTNVPSLVYPAIPARDEFYQYADIQVEKGDHIRLRDLRIDYSFPIDKKGRLRSCQVYAYVNNIAILWKANQAGIDPDNITGYPSPRSWSMGIQFSF